MKRLLVPLILLFVGLGGGVGAGLMLMPPAGDEAAAELANPCGDVPPPSEHEHAAAPEGGDEHHAAEASEDGHGSPEEHVAEDGTPVHDYVKLNNQFIVPIMTEGQVASLIQLSLSVEVPSGQQETVILMEPKLRDSFLRVLFDHANTGGFDGLFTASSAMRGLRASLLDAAQEALGKMVTDVLILDLVRQDT